MFLIYCNQQGAVKENLFAFRIGNAMFSPILADIAIVPLKTRDMFKQHLTSLNDVYNHYIQNLSNCPLFIGWSLLSYVVK